MGCSWKAASAWKICSLITDINQRVQFSLVTLSLTVSVLLSIALALFPLCQCGDFHFFHSFIVLSVGIFRMKLLSCYTTWAKSYQIYNPHTQRSPTFCPAQTNIFTHTGSVSGDWKKKNGGGDQAVDVWVAWVITTSENMFCSPA